MCDTNHRLEDPSLPMPAGVGRGSSTPRRRRRPNRWPQQLRDNYSRHAWRRPRGELLGRQDRVADQRAHASGGRPRWRRVGDQHFCRHRHERQPAWELLVDQLWVR
jgi:hypothetical protein